MSDLDNVVKIGIEALKNAFQIHEDLGARGLEPGQKNPHGETSLRGDIEAEKAVIETFREAKVPLRIIAEEHGQVDLVENPKFLAVLDGLDGTSVYKTARGVGRYGTMLGIFSNLNPTYGDYVFSGVMEHSTRKLFYASKDAGSFLLNNGEKVEIACSPMKNLNGNTRIYADEFFDGARNITFIHDTFLSKLRGYTFLKENSSAVHYIDLAQGDADLVLECTRKGNLEIAVAFGLVNEAGGVIVTIDGKNIKDKRYLELGQIEHIPIISASTVELARELIEKVNSALPEPDLQYLP